jgi:hypothetical protein
MQDVTTKPTLASALRVALTSLGISFSKTKTN